MAVNLGTVVCFAFAAVWGAAGAAKLPSPWRAWAVALSVLISVLGIVALRGPHVVSHAWTFRGGVYYEAVAFEVILIVAAVVVLRRLGREAYILPAVGIIVGLHFLGMWRAMDAFVFVWTAIGMCAASVAALFVPDSSEQSATIRQAVAGFGCAIVLWATGFYWWTVS